MNSGIEQDREPTNFTDPNIASAQPEGSLITSPKPTLSRRWFVLTLALVGCNQAAAASPYRLLLPRADRNFGDGTPIPTATPTAITPDRTPTPTATPTRTPTPEPTPDTRPSYPWPAEVLEQLRILPVLDKDKLRFGYYTNYNQIPYDDIKAIFTPEGGANADVPRRMVHLLTHQELTNMWVILTIGHEIFHHHEAWISMQNNPNLTIPFNYQQEYLNSPEGRSYVVASDAAVRNARNAGVDPTYLFPWEMPNFGVNTYEEAASVGSIWYHQRSWFDRDNRDIVAPLKDWARQWLPTATTVTGR